MAQAVYWAERWAAEAFEAIVSFVVEEEEEEGCKNRDFVSLEEENLTHFVRVGEYSSIGEKKSPFRSQASEGAGEKAQFSFFFP